MSYSFNEQFTAAARQFTDTAAQINRLALDNAQEVFGLQLSALGQNTDAAFAFLGEAAEVRDFDGFKTLVPKSVQVARENLERAVSTGQEVFSRTVKANEAIANIAKSQVESATVKAQAEAEKVVKAATKAASKVA